MQGNFPECGFLDSHDSGMRLVFYLTVSLKFSSPIESNTVLSYFQQDILQTTTVFRRVSDLSLVSLCILLLSLRIENVQLQGPSSTNSRINHLLQEKHGVSVSGEADFGHMMHNQRQTLRIWIKLVTKRNTGRLFDLDTCYNMEARVRETD